MIAHLDKQHNDLIEDIAQLQGSISGLGSEIADKEELVSLLEPQIQDARAVLDSLIARCNLQEAHYAEDNERRDEEIRVIDECIEILKGRVASATPGICGQVMNN